MFSNDLIAGSSGQSTGFYPRVINGSLRFNDDDSAYLSWTPDETGDSQKKFTLSFWFKRANLAESYLFSIGSSTADRIFLRLDSADNLDFLCTVSSTTVGRYTTSRVFRDTSAWYHIVVSVDTALANSDSIKVYVNGERDSTNPSTDFNNQSTVFGTQVIHTIGTSSWTLGSTNTDGYFADFYCIDNAQLSADDFGETKNGVWVAKNYAGTFGTNGFHLTFEDDAEVEGFNTVLYLGSGSQQSITGMGFKSDFLWIKNRDTSNNHQLMNSVVGLPNNLESNTTDAEDTTNRVSSFDSDGFTVEGNYSFTNQSGESYVAWGWKAGGSSNTYNVDGTGYASMAAAGLTDGTATLTGLSVSTTYGFSICTFNSGASGTQTFAHGLGTTPSLCIFKERNSGGASDHWVVWEGMTGNPATSYGYLNLTNAFDDTDTLQWSNTAPTSTEFTFNSGYAWSTSQDMIAYCWADTSGNPEGQRYSKFGSYAGGTDGYSVTGLGFKPAWVLIKPSAGGTGGWRIYDNTRDVANPTTKVLIADNPNDESDSSNSIDIDVDSFTLNGTSSAHNGSGYTYIYAAFADTREAAFWLDQSGNDNDWQPVNLDHNDTVADSPTDNFATWNGVVAGNFTLSEGNLKSTVGTNRNGIVSSIGFDPQDTDGFKAEFTINTLGNMVIGLADETFKTDEGTVFATTQARAVVYGVDGTVYDNGSSQGTFSSFTAGNVITMYVKSGSLYYAVNGTLANSGSAVVTGISEDKVFWLHALSGASSGTLTANFGQQPFVHTTSLDS
jgi:hypothetical protein